MKRILICLVAVLATAAYAENKESPKDAKTSKADKRPASSQAVKEAVVTGSAIPVKVDAAGRPLNSTLKVTVVGQEDIRVWGMGSPSGALGRLPFVSIHGR